MQVEGAPAAKPAEGKAGSINAMFDDALSAFISVLDQHSLAELAVLGRSPIEITGSSAAGGRGPRVRAKNPAARGSRRS